MSLQTKFIVSSNVSELKDLLENTTKLLDEVEVQFQKINNFTFNVKIEKFCPSEIELAPQQ